MLERRRDDTSDGPALCGQYVVGYPSSLDRPSDASNVTETYALTALETEFIEDHKKILLRELSHGTGIDLNIPNVTVCKSCGVKPDEKDRKLTI